MYNSCVVAKRREPASARAPIAALAVVLVGCGSSLEEARAPTTASPVPLTDGGRWTEPADAAPSLGPESGAVSRTLFRESSIVIGERAPPPAPTRPRARGRVDVSLRHADLENAARFLADAGKFNVVVESGLTGSVTAVLKGVDPYDALVTIAETNGAVVTYERGIVMVRRADAKR
jgi:hypothetical protein